MSIIKFLYTYPLKSGAAVSEVNVSGDTAGITGDREFCLYSPELKKFISMRDNLNIVNLYTKVDGNHLLVRTAHTEMLFDAQFSSPDRIRIWSRDVDVFVMPQEISEYISSFIGENVILSRLKFPGVISQSFMDTGPIHLISQHALESLSSASGYDYIDPAIFRPNLVVPDFKGLHDDNIDEIIINGVVFTVTERTERCNAVPLLHKKLQDIENSSLLEYLDEASDYEGAYFGLYLQAKSKFNISIGDELTFS